MARKGEEAPLDTTDEGERAARIRDAVEEDPQVFRGMSTTKPRAAGANPSRDGDAPPPMGDRDAGLDASIRLKQQRGQPLDDDERAFLARLNGDKQVWPGERRGERAAKGDAAEPQ